MAGEDDKKDGAGGKGDKESPRLNIKASDEAARGSYANLAVVHNNEYEFILDFVFVEPQRRRGQLVSRVMANPRTAKRLLVGLTELMRLYEKRFGEVVVEKAPPPKPDSYH